MTGFNFADSYRAAGLSAGPEVLKTRQAPFDTLRKKIDPQIAIDLTRLYYGLTVPRGTDWFRDAFRETDTSFSLIDNAREAAVLAAGLLEAAMEDGKVYAALAILATAGNGLRQPLVRPELLDTMRLAIQKRAIGNRQQQPVDPNLIKLPAKSKVTNELAALVQAPDIAKTPGLLKQVSEESAEITKTLTNQLLSVVQPLAAQVLTLREEVEILWWHIGGWSRLIEKPFAELEPGIAAVLAGIDMAEMSRSATGPAATPAILQRTLALGRDAKPAKISISEAVNGCPQDQLERLPLPAALGNVPDVCPLLMAFAKAKEIGAGAAWQAAYSRAAGLDAASTFAPLALAMQAYRERLLLRALG